MSEKLQKVLARSGVGSRREMEAAIAAGMVRVNGRTATLGDRVILTDKIEYNGRKVQVEAPSTDVRVLIYHKPEGVITTRKDPQGRPSVFDQLPRLKGQRWIAVGRLDINTSGLLIFTTDGELANALMHPSAQIDREYRCRVFGEVTDQMLQNLKQGVELEDGLAHFSDITPDPHDEGINRWYTVCLHEGRNREVRRLWESQGVQVNRLKRVRYGPVFLPSFVRAGESVPLEPAMIRQLYTQCNLATPEIHKHDHKEKVELVRSEKRMRAGGKQAKVSPRKTKTMRSSSDQN